MAFSEKRRVKWSEPALLQFYEILDWIAQDDLLNSLGFAELVEEEANSLESFAERGRVVPEFGDPSIREVFPKKYRLIYQIKDAQVLVLAFIHGNRLLSNA